MAVGGIDASGGPGGIPGPGAPIIGGPRERPTPPIPGPGSRSRSRSRASRSSYGAGRWRLAITGDAVVDLRSKAPPGPDGALLVLLPRPRWRSWWGWEPLCESGSECAEWEWE